jgi:GH15 family glucan-1,4-alpha-glucosidase
MSQAIAFTALADQSRALIRSHQDAGGAYPAGPTFSAYRGYAWLRDGAFIADGMSAAGEITSATAFFDWCQQVITALADPIARIAAASAAGTPVPDAEMLPTRFTLDGRGQDDGWENFQLDGYGLWLWAAAAHSERHGLELGRWRRGFELSVDYLVSSWDRPCYDWWEEHIEEVHVSTLGSVTAGLRAAVASGLLDTDRAATASEAADAATRLITTRGVRDGHLVKWIGSAEVDASLAALVGVLGVVEASSPLGLTTISKLDRELVADDGMHRFLADTYYGGGQWPLLSCFLGLACAQAGDHDRALELLHWAASTAASDGSMPEQVDRHLLDPSFVVFWEERWGTSADPLLWSSAMFLRLGIELGVLESVA